MKLLLVSAFYEAHKGGIERVAGALARALVARGVAVHWLAADASPPPEPGPGPQSAARLTTDPIPAWNGIERRLGVPVPIWGFGGWRRLRRALRDVDAVMLHDTLYVGNILAYLAAKLARKPIMIVQHVGPIAFSNPLLRVIMALGDRLVGRSMLARADQVVFISQTTADAFDSVRFRTAPALIFNGVDTEMFYPEDARPLPSRPLVLFSGRFVERKGLDVVAALARARPDVDFHLAGWGPMDPEAWGLPNVTSATIAGRAEMRDLYRAADLVILPSIGEGFPLVIQEALATGTPVICATETMAADPALDGVIDHAPVDLTDIPGTAAAWTRVLDDALARARAEDHGARLDRAGFAAARYGWTATVSRYQDLLARLG